MSSNRGCSSPDASRAPDRLRAGALVRARSQQARVEEVHRLVQQPAIYRHFSAVAVNRKGPLVPVKGWASRIWEFSVPKTPFQVRKRFIMMQLLLSATFRSKTTATPETATKNWIAQVRGAAELRSFTRLAMRASHEQGRVTDAVSHWFDQ